MAILVSWKGNFRTFQLMKVREKVTKNFKYGHFWKRTWNPSMTRVGNWNFGLVLFWWVGVELQK